MKRVLITILLCLMPLLGAQASELSCHDTDGGIDYMNKGKIFRGSNIYKNMVDYCVDETDLLEHDCGYENGVEGSEQSHEGSYKFACPNGCRDGACIGGLIEMQCGNSEGSDGLYSGCAGDSITHNPTGVKISVRSYDENELLVALFGAKQSGFNLKMSEPYSILSRSGVEMVITYEKQTDVHGAYIHINSAWHEKGCVDSDEGQVYYKKGIVKGWDDRISKEAVIYDSCISNRDISEAICLTRGPDTVIYRCPYGCESGVCIERASDEIECSDSDDGKSYSEKGTVTLLDDPTGPVKKTDFCMDDGLHLQEFSCINGIYEGGHTYRCENACENGACVSSSTGLLPDLVVTNVELGIRDRDRDHHYYYPVKVTFKNIGEARAQSVNAKISFSPKQVYKILGLDQVIQFDYIDDTTFTVPQNSVGYLAPGEEFTWIANINPDTTGYINIGVEVDSDDELRESSESNNSKTIRAYVEEVVNNGLFVEEDEEVQFYMNCGDTSGTHGIFTACKGDIMRHTPTNIAAKVIEYSDDKLELTLSGSKWSTLHLTKGEQRTVESRNDHDVFFTYLGSSTEYGVKVEIRSEFIRHADIITQPRTVSVVPDIAETAKIKQAMVQDKKIITNVKIELEETVQSIDEKINQLIELKKSFQSKLERLKDVTGRINTYNFIGESAEEIKQHVAIVQQEIESNELSDEAIEEKEKWLEEKFEKTKQKARLEKYAQGIIPFVDTDDDQWYTTYVNHLKSKKVISGFKDASGNDLGEYRPGNQVTRAEILKMAMNVAGKEIGNQPSSIRHWAALFIEKAKELNLDYYSKVLSYPNEPATRIEVVKLILQLFEVPIEEIENFTFPDLKSEKDGIYAEIAKGLGIVEGYSDGKFRPHNPINRAEVAKILQLAESLK